MSREPEGPRPPAALRGHDIDIGLPVRPGRGDPSREPESFWPSAHVMNSLQETVSKGRKFRCEEALRCALDRPRRH